MPDNKPKRTPEEQRSYNMSKVRSRDTSIEIAFRKALWHAGVRYRKNLKALPGSPDIAITKHKIAVFCDGEFWHGRDCESKKPAIKSNRDYWIKKIERNMQRDSEADMQLRALGWLVMRFWGDDINKDIALCVDEVLEAIFYVKMGIYDDFLSYSETHAWETLDWCEGERMTLPDRQRFINFMIGAGVLIFGDFTTKSGRKTPYFVNTGNYKTGMHISTLGDYYADCIVSSGAEFDALYGPAYKGITLAAAAASSLYRNYGIDVPYFFNRKEEKDHGEGGVLIGYMPKAGDRIVIIEDVVTAGTAVRESLRLLGDSITVSALFVSVDRMERGTGKLSTLDELRKEFGIKVYSIVTARDIIDALPAGDERARRIKAYLKQYGA